MKGTGLKIGLFNFSWTTTAFNRIIYRWSKNLTHFLRKWFISGYIVTVGLFLPFSLWTLTSFLYEHFWDTIEIDIGSVPEVKTLFPGINIPASDFLVYFVSLSLCSIFHELGHAMAAAQEDVQILAIGVSVFAIIPVAFVELNLENLLSLSATKRLKIYCAGVWHNIVCATIALLLFFSSPVLFSVGYTSNVGVKITGMSPYSPLGENRGLVPKDIVVAINGCEVKNMKDWTFCLHMVHERFGICTKAEFVAQNDEIMMESFKENDVVECCRADNSHSFCFEYIEPKVAGDSALPVQYSCLKPRDMIKNGFIKCTEAGGHMCPRNMHCLIPSLHNSSYFMVIERLEEVPVLYLGVPQDIQQTVYVDQYFPRNFLFAAFSPVQFEKLVRYIFMFSMGIAFINVLPCYGTDGHHIAKTIIQMLARYFNKDNEFVSLVTLCTIIMGTGVTVPLLMYLFYTAIVNDAWR